MSVHILLKKFATIGSTFNEIVGLKSLTHFAENLGRLIVLVRGEPSPRLVNIIKDLRTVKSTIKGYEVFTKIERLLQGPQKYKKYYLFEKIGSHQLLERSQSLKLIGSQQFVERSQSPKSIEKNVPQQFVERSQSPKFVEKSGPQQFVGRSQSPRLPEKIDSPQLTDKNQSPKLVEKNGSLREILIQFSPKTLRMQHGIIYSGFAYSLYHSINYFQRKGALNIAPRYYQIIQYIGMFAGLSKSIFNLASDYYIHKQISKNYTYSKEEKRIALTSCMAHVTALFHVVLEAPVWSKNTKQTRSFQLTAMSVAALHAGSMYLHQALEKNLLKRKISTTQL